VFTQKELDYIFEANNEEERKRRFNEIIKKKNTIKKAK